MVTTNTKLATENENNDTISSYLSKILIAEDNSDLLNYLTENLEAEHKVYSAKDGKEAWELCIKHEPDIIISDVMMPIMDGLELCHKVKNDKRVSHIPIILLTAKISIESEIQGFNEGADAYVAKPFNFEVLKARMQAISRSRENVWKKFKENPMYVPSDTQLTNSDQDFLYELTEHIENNISNSEFTVAQLSQSFDISHATFCKKVKSIVGVTPNQYIRSIRLKKAAELLLGNEFGVTEIIYKVGFNDLRYFREQFRKAYHFSPRDYRKHKKQYNISEK